jgi:hypothetical protein
MRTVQLERNGERRVAVVDGGRLRLLDAAAPGSVYALALEAIENKEPLLAILERRAGKEWLEYEQIYEGASAWRLLPSFDHPNDSARCMVSGTGLTHKASAENRAAMHKQPASELTDSMRMYRMGMEGGNPAPGQIGIQPEWFYKGDGSILRAHGADLEIPPYGWDGGEEPEIAGAYLISPDGSPVRAGLTVANEFSDHQMEKKNYLYLAPSKLRNCSIGPELAVGGEPFEAIAGTVSILRGEQCVWRKDIRSGQKNMSYSVANLEHHHFKYEAHRRAGDVHIHFFGADAFSFGDGLTLEHGEVMEVSFPQFGRPLRNRLRICQRPERLMTVQTLF